MIVKYKVEDMKIKKSGRVIHGIFLFALLAVSVPAFSFQPYTIKEIGTLGGSWSEATALNDLGQVAGTSEKTDGYKHAFIWQGGSSTDLGILGSDFNSVANDINNYGEVVGWSGRGTDHPGRGFLHTDDGMQEIGAFVGTTSDAHGINNGTQIAGEENNHVGDNLSFLWEADTYNYISGVGQFSHALAINEMGQVAGVGGDTDYYAPFIYDENTGLTWPEASSSYNCWIEDINDSGILAGWLVASGWEYGYPHIWDENGNMITLSTLGGTYGKAMAINNSGQVVGGSDTEGGDQHAFLWEDELLVDLNDLLLDGANWELIEARDINSYGQIVGYGTYDGATRGFIMIPIPEPATILLFAAGMAGVIKKKR